MKLNVNDQCIEIDELKSIILDDNEYLFIRMPEKRPRGSDFWVKDFFGDLAHRVILHYDHLEFAKVRFESKNNS